MKKQFTEWCEKEVFTPEIISASKLMQQALDIHLLSIYRKFEFEAELQQAKTPAELSDAFSYVESAQITIEAMLDRLAAKFDFVERTVDREDAKFRQVGPLPAPENTLDSIKKNMAEYGDDFLAPLEFLQFGEENFETALRDDPDLLDRILSGRESENQELWFRATNVDPLQNVHGIMGAVAIDMLLDSGRVLEIGGGTGNGIRNLLKHLSSKDALDRIEHYLFTDISQKFIMTTRREIMRDYPDVETSWRFADLNVPLQQQKIEQKSFDLIYAVNAAHVAKDIVAFLKSCKATLKPGGRVVFAERIRLTPRDMAPRELALNLSIYHRTAAIRNSDYRPVHCYLAPENWLRALELGGFRDADVWPDIDGMSEAFPDQYAAIVTGVA